MTKISPQYGIKRASPRLPQIDLLCVPHRSGVDLTVGYPAFGPDSSGVNIYSMKMTYSHTKKQPRVTFKGPTTSESISACSYKFQDFSSQFLRPPKLLQLGWIFNGTNGIWINPPNDEDGFPIIDEAAFTSLLVDDKKVNGIYLLGNDFAFVPYDTFQEGNQDCDTFAKSGLARGLEYTTELEAQKLKEISSKSNYPGGIYISDFINPLDIKSTACLGSDLEKGMLYLLNSGIHMDKGYSYGVLKE